jgi:hypothetical protein
MIQGQFNLTKIGDELVTNGDFATDSDWTLGSDWSIEGNKAIASGSNFTTLQPSIPINVSATKEYKINFDIDSVSGSLRVKIGGSQTSYINYGVGFQSVELYLNAINSDNLQFISANLDGSIDNVSVKEVRATTVEASKCLADAIHRIGIQDIQN